MSTPFPGTQKWLCSIRNTKKEHGPVRNVWPAVATGLTKNVTCYWEYNGSRSIDVLVDKFKSMPNLKKKGWEMINCGYVPLDTIYLKNEIASYLLGNPETVAPGPPAYYFGARYQHGSVEALFCDAEVEASEADSQESESAILDLA